MKKIILYTLILIASNSMSQNIGINATGAAPVSSAALDIDMVNKGLLIPRVALTSSITFAPITGTATTSLLVYNTSTAGIIPNNVVPGFYYWDGTKWISFIGSTTNDWSINGNTGTTPAANFLGTIDAQDLVFRTNNTEKVRVLTNGNVGIGTSAPVNKLHVKGGVKSEIIGGNSSGILLDPLIADIPKISFRASDNTNRFEIVSRINTLTNLDKLYFRSIAIGPDFVDTIMTLNGGTGAVGIGTANPTVKLDVAGVVSVGKDEDYTVFSPFTNNTYGSQLRFSGVSFNTDPVWIAKYNVSNDVTYLRFNVGDNLNLEDGFQFGQGNALPGGFTTFMHIEGTGNVSIGSITPLSRLDVMGARIGSGMGTGVPNNAPSQSIVTAGLDGTSYLYDWPVNWGGGIATWDIVGNSTFFNANVIRSDRKLKKDILTIDNNIKENFMKLRPVTYLLKVQTPETNGTQYGFIAQEVAELFPSLVTEESGKEGAIIGMNYQGLIAPTVYVVQQLQEEINLLKQQNAAILKRLKELEKK